jgi:lipopolysaccharide/colanic/teichoic acid biosynthesis glycosyltransferase
MLSETLPLAAYGRQALLSANAFSVTFPEKSEMTFLYIGMNDVSARSFSRYFKQGIFALNFKEASDILQESFQKNNPLPDVIVIDMPLNKESLENFYKFQGSKIILSKTAIVYNDAHLTADDITYLKQSDAADDVININNPEVNYAKKVTFLKNCKRPQSPLYISRDDQSFFLCSKNDLKCMQKRVFDIIVSSILILLCTPLYLLIALAIRLESKGPVFYTSQRAGRGFKIFNFFKFRTMEVDADKKIDTLQHLNQYSANEAGGAKFIKICNDPRVTKVGKFLRNTSLDELPQLFNVLKGDMSLVGNRPLPLYEASTLTTDDCVERFMAPAGITGLWQVKKRSNLNMSTKERIDLDISYARKYSFIFDMWIIAQTPAALFQKANV